MIERVYYTGFLAADRYANNELDELATMLLSRAERGEIILLQRRLSFAAYEYIAIENTAGRGDTKTRPAAALDGDRRSIVAAQDKSSAVTGR
jgi:hypothetical protein